MGLGSTSCRLRDRRPNRVSLRVKCPAYKLGRAYHLERLTFAADAGDDGCTMCGQTGQRETLLEPTK